MSIVVKPVQPENAASPILVTEFGMVIEVKPEQPMNAASPILVTELSNFITPFPLE